MNIVIDKHTRATKLNAIVIDDDVDVYAIPRRSYDFGKGDRRFLIQEDALKHAEQEAVRTGVRQVVRLDSSPHFATFYLVQAVGS